MTGKRKTTASVSSVGADGKQPNLKNDTEIIANETAQINLQATDFCGFDTNTAKARRNPGAICRRFP